MTPVEQRALQRDTWADAQIQQALSVLLPDRASDWFEDHSQEARKRALEASWRRLDNATSYRRTAHFLRRGGDIGGFKIWIDKAIREIGMAKHYQRKTRL